MHSHVFLAPSGETWLLKSRPAQRQRSSHCSAFQPMPLLCSQLEGWPPLWDKPPSAEKVRIHNCPFQFFCSTRPHIQLQHSTPIERTGQRSQTCFASGAWPGSPRTFSIHPNNLTWARCGQSKAHTVFWYFFTAPDWMHLSCLLNLTVYIYDHICAASAILLHITFYCVQQTENPH